MRLQTITRIRCDCPTCDQYVDMVTPPDREFWATVKAAVMEAGWSVSCPVAVSDILNDPHRFHFCPDHNPVVEQDPPAGHRDELVSIVEGLIEVVANMTNHVDGWKQPGGDPTALNTTHRLARRVAALRRADP